MTITLVFGKWVPPHWRCSKDAVGFCLGWFAFTIYFFDLEIKLEKIFFGKEKGVQSND